MKTFFAKAWFAATLLTAVCAAQASVIGNLNDGLNHTASTTGYWSLFVNAGDNVTVTARRLDPIDLWAFALDGPDGTGVQVGAGDDELPAYAGGPYGDPSFHFTAAITGAYSVGVFRCCSRTPESISYFVSAQGATGSDPSSAVPEPGTIALLGLGLSGLALRARKLRAV